VSREPVGPVPKQLRDIPLPPDTHLPAPHPGSLNGQRRTMKCQPRSTVGYENLRLLQWAWTTTLQPEVLFKASQNIVTKLMTAYSHAR
jgi:hypothetical protein